MSGVPKRGFLGLDQIARPFVLFVDQHPDFAVDLPGGLFAIVAWRLGWAGLQKDGLPVPFTADLALYFAHAVGLDHAFGNIGGLPQIVLRPGGDLAVDDFLRRTPSQ